MNGYCIYVTSQPKEAVKNIITKKKKIINFNKY